MTRGPSRQRRMAGDSGIGPITMGIGMDRTVATGTGYIGQYPRRGAKTV